MQIEEMKKTILLSTVFLLFFLFIFGTISNVDAKHCKGHEGRPDAPDCPRQEGSDQRQRGIDIPVYTIPNPLQGQCQDIPACITFILKFLRDKIGIPLAAIAIVWAGFKFLTAQGNATKISEARKIFLWTLAGVALIVIAESVASYIEQILKTGG